MPKLYIYIIDFVRLSSYYVFLFFWCFILELSLHSKPWTNWLKYVYIDLARGLSNVFTVRTFAYGMFSFCVTMLLRRRVWNSCGVLIQSLSLQWIIFPLESLLFMDSFPLKAFMLIIQLPFGARTSYCSQLLSSSSNLDHFVNYRSFANELQRNHMFPWISCHNLRYLYRTPGVLLVNYWWKFKFVWMKARAQWIPNCNIHFS